MQECEGTSRLRARLRCFGGEVAVASGGLHAHAQRKGWATRWFTQPKPSNSSLPGHMHVHVCTGADACIHMCVRMHTHVCSNTHTHRGNTSSTQLASLSGPTRQHCTNNHHAPAHLLLKHLPLKHHRRLRFSIPQITLRKKFFVSKRYTLCIETPHVAYRYVNGLCGGS